MGCWLVLVSPCFRENVIATCKTWYFLGNLDNLLQKIVMVCLKFKFQNGALLKELLFLKCFFTFLVTLTFDCFVLPILEKNTNLLSMVSLWYDSWALFNKS